MALPYKLTMYLHLSTSLLCGRRLPQVTLYPYSTTRIRPVYFRIIISFVLQQMVKLQKPRRTVFANKQNAIDASALKSAPRSSFLGRFRLLVPKLSFRRKATHDPNNDFHYRAPTPMLSLDSPVGGANEHLSRSQVSLHPSPYPDGELQELAGSLRAVASMKSLNETASLDVSKMLSMKA